VIVSVGVMVVGCMWNKRSGSPWRNRGIVFVCSIRHMVGSSGIMRNDLGSHVTICKKSEAKASKGTGKQLLVRMSFG
jgi:hypothetical protein